MLLLPILYAIASYSLALYGLQALLLTMFYIWKEVTRVEPLVAVPKDCEWPILTIQLPIYNEKAVVERLLFAVTSLDYPRARLQIQVLDDSDDETTRVLQQEVLYYRKQGYWINLMRRHDRTGFKAGALATAFVQVKGDFIAIFDADFAPAPDWAQKSVLALIKHPAWGFVQTRWGHLNAPASWLTRAQAIALDGHFVVEQGARSAFGLPFGFNGSGGIWRRQTIEDAGGWQADTLCEDLDLSYRAQLRGWQGGYLPDVVAPAELPPSMSAWKQQQFRWAKGSVQVMRKVGGDILREKSWSWTVKIAAFWHLSGYISHLFLLLLLALLLPMIQFHLPWVPFLAPIGLLGFGPILLYVVSQQQLYDQWLRRLLALPFLLAVGVGLALNNSVAVLEGIIGQDSPFRRTPKYNLSGANNGWVGRGYAPPVDPRTGGELLLAGYALVTLWAAWRAGDWLLMPFISLFVIGFAWVGWQSLRERRVAIRYTRQAAVRRSLS